LSQKPSYPSAYQQLMKKTRQPEPRSKNVENDLDALLGALKDRQQPEPTEASAGTDPIRLLRDLTVRELVPAFVELVEKYSPTGISMQMDASNLLEGGREVRFEFGYGEYRMQLQGTATANAIAFHEVRYAPDVQGQLAAGPMLRLRQLDGKTFREFVCERLAVLLRFAARRR